MEKTQEKAAQATSVLSSLLLGYAVRAETSTQCLQWAAGKSAPTPEQEERLDVVVELLDRLNTKEWDDEGATARAWFQGSGIDAGKLSPIEAIRDGRYDEVRAALTHFINCDFTT